MFSLIMKDMKISFNKRTIIAYIFYFVMYTYTFSDNYIKTIELLFFVCAMFVMSNILSIFAVDERYNWDTIVNSLPIEKRKIVFARYLSILVEIIIYLIAIVVGVFIVNSFMIIESFTINNLKCLLNIISMILIYTSITVPVYFKYGVRRTVFGIFLLFVLIGSAGFIYYGSNKFSISKILIIKLASLCMFVISYLVSANNYTPKDIN